MSTSLQVDKVIECDVCGKPFYCVNCIEQLYMHKIEVHDKTVNDQDPNLCSSFLASDPEE